jgi:uncharacterized membrane protein
MDGEERKLQIELAKLQTDVQIWLTMCFGSIALFGALILGAWQEYYSTSADQAMLKNSFLSTIGIGIVGLVFITYVCAKRMQSKRDAMDKL